MGAGGADCAGDVQGRDGDIEYILGKYGSHFEREGGLQGHWSGRGAVECVLSGG